MKRVFSALAIAIPLVLAASASAQEATPGVRDAAGQENFQRDLRSFADRATEMRTLIQRGVALQGEVIELSGLYVLGFRDADRYAQERPSIEAAHADLGVRITAFNADVAALAEPQTGAYAARSLELTQYLRNNASDLNDSKTALDRLPAIVDARDASGFDETRALILRYPSALLRAENALMSAGQLSIASSHPEFHLLEAIKESNNVVAGLLELIAIAKAGHESGEIRDAIGQDHRDIYAALDIAAKNCGIIEAQLLAQSPTASKGIKAYVVVYRAAFEIEKRIAESLVEYTKIAGEIASGTDPAEMRGRLEAVSALIQPLVAERLAAATARQEAGIALAGVAP